MLRSFLHFFSQFDFSAHCLQLSAGGTASTALRTDTATSSTTSTNSSSISSPDSIQLVLLSDTSAEPFVLSTGTVLGEHCTA
jgi:hypothetical protein